MSDYQTKKEIELLSNEKKYNQLAIDTDKYAFQRKLFNGMGEQMMKELNNPPKKLSWWAKLRLKYALWKTLRANKKEIKEKMKPII